MASTYIGNTIVIEGEISSEEDVVVQGTVKGRISVQENIYVEPAGVIEAEVDTKNIEIAGQVTGNITAGQKVEITPGGI